MRIVDWSADVCSSDLAAGRGRAEGVERLGLGAPAPAALRRLGDADDRRVHADVEDFGGARQLRIFAVVKQIGAITPEPRHDDLAALGMRPDLAWQAEQSQRIIEVEILAGNILRERRTLRLLAIAELDIGTETAAAPGDF